MRKNFGHLMLRSGNLKRGKVRFFSTFTRDDDDDATELKDFIDYIDYLKNYEKSGVPQGAGTDSDRGFDLGRMSRLMDRLDNPLSKFKAVHIAGTKGKGSTAAFLSNILRAEGYSVGCYTSPHILSIRERIQVGRSNEPVSAKTLNCLFHRIKHILDHAVESEQGRLSHFEAGLGGVRDATNVISSAGLAASIITTIGEEHLAALGGSLESIALAKAGIIKQGRPLVLGGPFLPHIEHILHEKAVSVHSPIVSACDVGIRATVKGLGMLNDRPCQSCDMMIQIQKDIPLFVQLSDLNLSMLGSHQLQNAVTAACAALCLRHQGWRISDESIRAGLENTRLLGRSQFLTSKEAETLGLPGANILLDGAHTKESAKALVEMIRMTFPEAKLALVVAMASDKDHAAFAKEFLSSKPLEAVFLTEASIAGGKTRTTSPSMLRDCWIQASKELGVNILHSGMVDYQNMFEDQLVHSTTKTKHRTILAAEGSLMKSMRATSQILRARTGNEPCILVVTGSLHIVSMVLASL